MSRYVDVPTCYYIMSSNFFYGKISVKNIFKTRGKICSEFASLKCLQRLFYWLDARERERERANSCLLQNFVAFFYVLFLRFLCSLLLDWFLPTPKFYFKSKMKKKAEVFEAIFPSTLAIYYIKLTVAQNFKLRLYYCKIFAMY